MAVDFKNILITKPSSLGDIVMALPALAALRRGFPDAKISWLVRPEFAALLEDHPHLDEIIAFDRRFLGKAWHNPKAFASLLCLIRQLRRNKFDAVIDLQGLFRTACLAWLCGSKNRFGMADAREFAHIFYTHKVSASPGSLHMVDYYLEVVKAAGVTDLSVHFELPPDQKAADAIENLLRQHNINSESYAVFIPCSSHADKCWPADRFAELAGKISSEFGLAVAATAAAAEKDDVDKIKKIAKVPIANFAGLTNLKELVELLRKAKLIVSNDTGPGHIAAALRGGCVFIYGCSNPARVGPYKMADCVAAVEPGSRGPDFKSDDPKFDIKNITFEQVYQKVCGKI